MLRYFPLKWKTAAVIPILKPLKDPTRAYSFRPIALLSILGKVSEKIILKRLYHHVDSINLIIPEQHGFRPDFSTSHQLLRVVEAIKSGSRKQKSTDDTAILATHTEPKPIARALNRLDLEDWFLKWKITLNIAKTERQSLLH
ncbi:putative RNA-directed DNA polymerase from transposon X-element [Trichonephila clavipes]|nr:putative RNA-directed DNA polymerase from transposon X-element [Trichonephila clavipes]